MESKPFFPPRTPIRDDFPEIALTYSSYGFGALKVIAEALDRLKIEKPIEIGVIAPEKTVHLPDSLGENLLTTIPHKIEWLHACKSDTRFEFKAMPGMVLLPNHRFKSSPNPRNLYWDKPACAITTEAFAASPIKHVILYDDVIRTGDTLAAMYHAATTAGKTVLMICASERHMGYPYLQQTPELKNQLQLLTETSPNLRNEANQALQQIGYSLDTLTGLQLYTLLHVDPMFTSAQGLYNPWAKPEFKTADGFLEAIKTRVEGAKKSYSTPEHYMCLEYLRRHNLTPDRSAQAHS